MLTKIFKSTACVIDMFKRSFFMFQLANVENPQPYEQANKGHHALGTPPPRHHALGTPPPTSVAFMKSLRFAFKA